MSMIHRMKSFKRGNLKSHPAVVTPKQSTMEEKSKQYMESKEEKLERALSLSEEQQRKVTIHNDLITNAKDIIDATNMKIKQLNNRLSSQKKINNELELEIEKLHDEEKEKHIRHERYKLDIEKQKVTITKWKQKMEQLSDEIIIIRQKEREQALEYANKNVTISDNLYKVSGDSVSKLKFNQMHSKFVVFTEKINHLFYYDDSGLKLVFVRGITINNNDIESQINNKSWFLIIGKKRSVLFITSNIKQRDKWVTFINRSLANKSNLDGSDDEISLVSSLVEVAYDLESNQLDFDNTNYANYANQFHQHRRSNKQYNSSTLIPYSNKTKPKRKNKARSNSLLGANYNDAIHVMVMYEIKPHKINLFLKTIKQLIIATNKEKGCIKFNLHKDKSSRNKFIMMEIWESQKYLTNHLQQQHLKMYRDIIAQNDVHKSKPNVFFCNTLL